MAAADTTTPFAPVSARAAHAPIAIAVMLVAVPVCASVVRRGIESDVPAGFAGIAVWGIAVVAAALLAAAVTSTIALQLGRALATFGGATLLLSFALASDGNPRDTLLVGGMLVAPVAILSVLAMAPLVLAARFGAREPDAREHFATSSAVWLFVASCALDAPFRELGIVVAAGLAALSFQRDLWRATWLRRVRHGAVAGVRLARPWPTATERLEVVVHEGAGPFRRAMRVDRSDVVRIAWLRVAASLAVVALCAAYVSGLL